MMNPVVDGRNTHLRWAKFFRTKKRIVSGVKKKLEIMRFLVGRFTPFSSGIEILPSLKSSNRFQ